MKPSRTIRCIAAAALLAIAAFPAHSQVNYNQRDDKYRVLGLKRAKEAYETARRDYERQEELFKRSLIAQADLDHFHNIMADAEVNYQQSLLAVLFEQQFVSVSRAVKYQARGGAKHVRLTVANTSGETAEFQKLLNIDDKLFRSLQPDVVNDVYISITNPDGAVISQPYESKIAQLRYGEPVTLDFGLLQDMDAVTVNMIYGSGSSRSMKIFLQKDASVNKVAVQSEQFSQEIELGKSATFDLTLELFSGVSNTFSLEVLNLPPQIDRFFKDPSGQARLSQFKFTETTNTRKAALEVSLPDRPTEEVPMDRPIPFFVVVVPHDRAESSGEMLARTWTQQEIEKMNVGFVKLELVTRGAGKLLVRAPQLFFSIRPEGSVQMSVEVVNEGTRRLDNVEVKIDPPLNWTREAQPAVVPSLGIGEDRRVDLTFTPPHDVSVGRYEIRLRTSALSDNHPVNAEDKTATVEIAAGASVLGTALLVLLIVGLVGGIVVFGIKLTRK
ncbi:MAG TPA: NEW3 domain-containing protein [Bacteroidota bacterium]|nr:NEW3 domain-containing protein [Bacteroidota bacterium]